MVVDYLSRATFVLGWQRRFDVVWPLSYNITWLGRFNIYTMSVYRGSLELGMKTVE